MRKIVLYIIFALLCSIGSSQSFEKDSKIVPNYFSENYDSVKFVCFDFLKFKSGPFYISDSLNNFIEVEEIEVLATDEVFFLPTSLDSLSFLRSIWLECDLQEDLFYRGTGKSIRKLGMMGKIKSEGLPDAVFGLNEIEILEINLPRNRNRKKIIDDLNNQIKSWPNLKLLNLYGLKKRDYNRLIQITTNQDIEINRLSKYKTPYR